MRDCRHGQQARACYICELEADLAEARKLAEEWRGFAVKLYGATDYWYDRDEHTAFGRAPARRLPWEEKE